MKQWSFFVIVVGVVRAVGAYCTITCNSRPRTPLSAPCIASSPTIRSPGRCRSAAPSRIAGSACAAPATRANPLKMARPADSACRRRSASGARSSAPASASPTATSDGPNKPRNALSSTPTGSASAVSGDLGRWRAPTLADAIKRVIHIKHI